MAKAPDASLYDNGTPVSLTATADAGYYFVNWSGDAAGTNNPVGLVMDSNKTVTAIFAMNIVSAQVDCAAIAVPEGGATTFQVRLSAQPGPWRLAVRK